MMEWMSILPDELVGLFVVEVGVRQSWPFLRFCDNSVTPAREIRLYLDSPFEVGAADAVPTGAAPVERLFEVNNLPVFRVRREGPKLAIDFAGGTSLVISGVPSPTTTGDVWWLSPWLEAGG